jgi:post-segregation antitoxin (ccd killing protein)
VAAPPSAPNVATTRKELYERARELGIEGRSKMTKAQLGDAVRRAETEAG